MNDLPLALGLNGLLRRLGAACYDGLLLGGLLMVTIGIATYATRPLGERVLDAYPHRTLYQLVALTVIVLFYGTAWTSRGQTLGMKAWRIRLVRADGDRATWRDVLIRLAVALPLWLLPVAGLFLFMHHSAGGLVATATAVPLAISLLAGYEAGASLHDRLSSTRVITTDDRLRA